MDDQPYRGYAFLLRVLLKAALLFALCNLVYAAAAPAAWLGELSLYNRVWPGRERLPYGEDLDGDRNLTLDNVPAMLASHAVSVPKGADEYRVLLLGDSATWGWLLGPEETAAAALGDLGLIAPDGRRVAVYNLGYPVMSLSKDLLLLDAALATEPDLVIWLVTLESFAPANQLAHPLLQNNPVAMRRLIADHDLALDAADPRFVDPDFWQRTLVGQRRPLADLLRLQALGAAWAATGVDQDLSIEVALRSSDLAADGTWQGIDEAQGLTGRLAIDALAAGAALAGNAGVDLLLVNEPMFISAGANSGLRYNAFYPRWAYDEYRRQLAAWAVATATPYHDFWDLLPPDTFTDSPVHTTPDGSRALAAALRAALAAHWAEE